MPNSTNFDSLFANTTFPGLNNSSIGTFANAAANPFMTKSPLTDFKWQFLKRDSKEIEELFVSSVKPKSSGIVTLAKEDDCQCSLEVQELLKDTLAVYYESGTTPGFQNEEDSLLFYIKIFVSRDFFKIEQAAKECKPDPNEILFFLEDNTDDWSSQKMYATFGDLVTTKLKAEMTDKSALYRKIQSKVPNVTPEMIDELLQKGYIEQPFTATRLFIQGITTLVQAFGLLGKAIQWVCDTLGDAILQLSLPEKTWNTDSSDYLGKKDNLIAALTISQEKIDFLTNQVQPSKYHIPKPYLDQLLPQTLTVIKAFIKRYNEFAKAAIEKIYDFIATIAEELDKRTYLSERIAFICGVWNGLVDFVGGILKFIGMLAAIPYDVATNYDYLLELFDSFCESWHTIDLSAAFNNALERIKNYLLTKNLNSINTDKVAYCIGFGIAFAGTFYIPIANLGKIANFSKIGKALLPISLLEDMSAAATKATNALGEASKAAYDEGIRILKEIVSLLQKGKDFLIDFLTDVGKKIVDWFVKSMDRVGEIMGLGLSKETAEILDNLGLLVRKQTSRLVGMGGGVVIHEFSIIYKGVVIFEGSANEVQSLAKILKRMTTTERAAYLENLLNKVFIIGRHFLEHIEQGHISIQILDPRAAVNIISATGERIKNPARLIREYAYTVGRGSPPTTFRGFQASWKSVGGSHLLSKLDNRLINIVENIGTRVIATGESVRFAKIDYWVEELGKWVRKDEIHTFFPRRWDINKVQEVVKEATQNIVFKNGNKYRGITKKGVEIEFYIDEITRELQTAYIHFP
jgi:hypothetical protein